MKMMTDDALTLDRIVNDLDANLLVEAGAGTGKTYALVSRVVALIKAGVKMENIVAITFTEAAAAELSDRIRSRMEQLLDDTHPDNDGDLLYADLTPDRRTRIAQAVADLDQASIQTIHSFAAQLLRQRPMEVGLPPGWTGWDGLAADQDFREEWSRWLEWALGNQGGAQAALAPALRYLLEHDVSISHWNAVASRFSGAYHLLTDAGSLNAIDLRAAADEVLGELQGLAGLCTDPSDRLYEQLAAAIATVEAVADAGDDPMAAVAALEAGDPVRPQGGVGRAKSWPGTTTREVRDQFRDAGTAFGLAVRTAPAGPLLESLRQAFAVAYPLKRKSDGVASFDDLLVWARDLLLDPAARRYFQTQYTHVLIDEFQDTDPLQAEIGFYLASQADANIGTPDWHTIPLTPGRLFIVGDAKQSIYQFRGADLTVTQKVKDGGRLESLTLTENRRSQEPILRWVNRIFGELMADGSGLQPDYVPLRPHDAIQSDEIGAGVILFGGPTEGKVGEIRRIQARHLANMLVTFAFGGDGRLEVYDKETREVRPARLGDVCILIRTRNDLGIMERGLEDAGVPFRIEGGSLLFNTQEVRDLLNCLRAIDDPTDSVSVAAALRSPAFSCSDVELLQWREARGSWDYRDESPEAGPAPVASGMGQLAEYHERRHDVPVAQLISEFIRDRRLEELDLAEPRPREMWRRREFLVEQARNLANGDSSVGQGAPLNLHRFNLWARMQQEESMRITEVPVPETDDDAVRIMTMHAAKGLEFPIVALLGLDYQTRARRDAVLFDPDSGVAEISMGNRDAAVQTPGYRALADAGGESQKAEEIRLAYVAATRARDHLFISLYHKATSNGSAPNETMGAILGLGEDPLQGSVSVRADTALVAPTTGAELTGFGLSYDVEAWQERRAEVVDNRSVRQAVTATWVARQADATAAGSEYDNADVVEDKESEPEPDEPWRTGRGGTAFGSALHAVLQDAVTQELPHGKMSPDDSVDALLERLYRAIDGIAGQHAEAEGVEDSTGDIARLAKRAVRNDAVVAAFQAERLWAEIPVAAPVGPDEGAVVIEGIIDLMFLDRDDELVIVDYKSDDVSRAGVLDEKLEHYKWQGAAYASAVQRATGKRVKDVQFLFVRIDEAHSVKDLDGLVRRLPGVVQT